MGTLQQLFSFGHKDPPELQQAIERAVNAVEPQLKGTLKYPGAFRKPVKAALEYARDMALSVPGPINADLDAYAHNAYVHAVFPSMEVVSDAIRTSRAMQEYLQANPATREIYALMGMRRREKTMMGMELSGEVIHRDVPQQVVYFSSHTVENPAPSEEQARQQVSWAFFDSLVKKVVKQVESRKQELQAQQQEMELLMAKLHNADPHDRPAMQARLSKMLSEMQAARKSLDLHKYPEDFEAVLLHPEKHLWLNQLSLVLDSMGIERENTENGAKTIVFNELVGFDRRDWTVAIVHCHDIPGESFASRLEDAYRKLSII